ncbi:Abp140p [Sugiyamaella lignohabitans]|uniref:tRNA N(3)-methylcytidine methyltransferase n=1 Tax=Sugiyamaella lignohabitans TaxID=796027 RepID=A0A167CQE0_9ASCO|nr:Abp140p [Sugiyamaella lignohabitans]ANB11982.1 Abp140p [Sugiyamaella lignohabitans]
MVEMPETQPEVPGPVDTSVSRLERGDTPFTFGQRNLVDEEQVWNHNAWDNVEWGEEQITEAEEKLVKQREAPVKPFDKKLFMSDPAKYWNQFYRNNRENFFKDRKWLRVEFPSLYEATRHDAGKRVILEVGCGAGNTMFPVLEANENPDLMITGVDFSNQAVKLVKESKSFDPKHAHAAVWDLAEPSGALPEGIEEHSVDIVVMIFVFSALAPDQWEQAVRNLKKLLKPDGEILFRDYGRYDLTQLRFKGGRLLDDNFYIRGDGTRVYFFTEEELEQIFGKEFEVAKIAADRRLLVNRLRKLKMYRIWMQARFVNRLE